MDVKLVLSSKALLEKVFTFSNNGYDAYQVDEFLDRIINDYKIVENNLLITKESINIYTDRIEVLTKENNELKAELEIYKKKYDGISDSKNVTNENLEYIKRISLLEKALYKQGIDPTKIK